MKLKVNISKVLVDMYNEPLERDNKGTSMDVKDVIMQALLTPENPERGKEVDSKTKFEKYRLYQLVRPAITYVVLEMDDVTLIKKLIGETKPPLIMGQAWESLDAAEKVPEKEVKKATKDK